MKRILVVAPHPDDETLGCGGTLLKHIENGDEVSWLIVTAVSTTHGFSEERVRSRSEEIEKVAAMYGFSNTYQLQWPTMQLDTIPTSKLVGSFSDVFNEVKPEVVYVPYRGDVHTDHRYVFDAAISCTKWFRYPFVKRVLAYETLSETEFGLATNDTGFRPNVFTNITPYTKRKWEIMQVFASEIGEFPFPRSFESIDALHKLRGSTAGCEAAESFMLLKEVIE